MTAPSDRRDAASTSAPPPPAATELSLDEAVRYAIGLQRSRQLDAAETLYRRVLQSAPEHPDALHYLGLLTFQRGRADEAVALLERAAARVPDYPDFHSNLGNVFTALGRVAEAADSYARALALDPQRADFHNNLGVLLRVTGNPLEAEAEFLRATELDPAHFRAYNNLGMLHAAQGNIEAAVQNYCRSITLMPSHPDGHKLLGLAYYATGQLKEAAEVFRQWLAEQPDDPVARHMLAACSDEGVPERADDDFIVETFDRFADSFEEQLQQRLAYKAPQLVTDALGRHLPAPAGQLHILDAGCGTGLCGPLVKPHAARLTGVDLSVGMLQKAEGKGCYDHLYRIELGAFLAMPDEAAAWDVILSADTLCYFGPLEAVAAGARRALRPGGLFGFSVEDAGDRAPDGHLLNPHGRYAHSAAYVRRCLEGAGFAVLGLDPAVLRTEGGKPVHGLIVVARAA